MLETTFGSEASAKTIGVKYLVVDALSSYNAILRRHTINLLWMVFSTLHLTLKYPLLNGRLGVVNGGQKIAQEFY